MAEKIPDFEPPQACVARIVKNVLPDSVQISKEARVAFTRAAGDNAIFECGPVLYISFYIGIFIFYLTNCANEFSKEGKRSTITTADVLSAIKELDFQEFEPALKEFIEKFRKESGKKKSVGVKRSIGEAIGSSEVDAEAEVDAEDGEAIPDDDVPDQDLDEVEEDGANNEEADD